MYYNLFWLDGPEALELIDLIGADGPESVLNYLVDALGDPRDAGEEDDIPWHGPEDETYTKGGYTLSWHSGLGYIGLEYEDRE